MQVSMGDIALLVSSLDSSPVNTTDVRKLLTKVTQNFVNHCIVANTCSAQSFVIPSTHPNTCTQTLIHTHTHTHTHMHTHVHTASLYPYHMHTHTSSSVCMHTLLCA